MGLRVSQDTHLPVHNIPVGPVTFPFVTVTLPRGL